MNKETIHPIRGLVFDLDGTIADTIPAITLAMNRTLAQYDFPRRSQEEIRKAIGNGARKLVSRSMPPERAENEALVDQVKAAYDASYALTYMQTDTCYEGIPEAVRTLAERGYHIAVLSNKQDPYVAGLVQALLPAGTVSFAIGQGTMPTKPDPTAPLYILKQWGITPAEALMIGDSEVDVKTARNAGMRGVIGCAWGFRGRRVLEEIGADYVIDTPQELLAAIQSFS